MFFNEINYSLQVPGEAQFGTVRLSYGCGMFEKDESLFIPDDREFLGFYSNLGNDFHFTFNDLFAGTLQKGQYIFMYQPRASCEYGVRRGKSSEFGFHFTPEFLRALTLQFPFLDPFLKSVEAKEPFALTTSPILMTPKMATEIKRVLYCKTRWDEERSIYLFSRVLDILELSFEQISFIKGLEEHQSYDTARIDKVHNYLLDHLQNQCNLSLLADEVGMEPRSMTRNFKRIYGKTVIEFLFDERMKKAMSLMRSSEMNVEDIAHSVGYVEHTNFSRAFKRKFGYSPTHFRQSDLKED